MKTYPPLDPEWVFPAGDRVKCGNRLDLPRKQRRHDYRDAGIDVRHQFSDGAYVECRVAICVRCGQDTEERLTEDELSVLRASAVYRVLAAKYGADMVTEELVSMVLTGLAEEN
jgi:hypothetical protein